MQPNPVRAHVRKYEMKNQQHYNCAVVFAIGGLRTCSRSKEQLGCSQRSKSLAYVLGEVIAVLQGETSSDRNLSTSSNC